MNEIFKILIEIVVNIVVAFIASFIAFKVFVVKIKNDMVEINNEIVGIKNKITNNNNAKLDGLVNLNSSMISNCENGIIVKESEETTRLNDRQ